MLSFLGGGFLGWSLGANDAANVFGTAVSARMVRWRTAAILAALFVVVGAVLQGAEGMHTLGGLTRQTTATAGIGAICAAATVTLMTVLRIPVSTSQAVVGTLVGIGLVEKQLNLSGLSKVAICWVSTPIGAMLLSALFYYSIRLVLRVFNPTLFTLDPVLRIGLIICGCYGSYALGANNVANVAGFFAANPAVSVPFAVLLGGVSIAAGVLTFSRGVMLTVGKGITPLDGYSALIVVLSQAVTVHAFAMIGVPVSTSQAIIGAVLGIGMVKGIQIINYRSLARVVAGWVSTPFIAAGLAGAVLIALRWANAV